MGRHRTHLRPDYVDKYHMPENTEIRHIKGKWYLYKIEKNPVDGSKKYKIKSTILGLITQDGLIESAKRKKENFYRQDERQEAVFCPQNISDTLEIGASSFFYLKSNNLRERLKKFFPDMWQFIYVTHLLRLIYEAKFKRLKVHYQYSILSAIYPYLYFNPKSVNKCIKELGKRRSAIREFMKEDLNRKDTYLLIDGHRLITSSKKRELPEIGYDSKQRYKPQINLLYIFSLSKESGIPAYYKQYSGSTLDVVAFSDILLDANLKKENVIIVTDKGVCSSDDMTTIAETGLQYIIPLDRRNKYAKGKIPNNPLLFTQAFSYNGRPIFFNEIE